MNDEKTWQIFITITTKWYCAWTSESKKVNKKKCSFWTKIIDINYRHKVSWILCHIQCRISLTSIMPKKYVMVSYPSDNNNIIKYMNYVVTKNIRKKNCIWNFFILCVKSTSWYNWKVQIIHLCLDKAFTFTFSFG